MTVGDLIVNYRAEHNISQRKFASLCGMSNAYLSMVEHNRNPQTGKPVKIGPKFLTSIANVMLLTPNELIQAVDPGTIDYFPLDPDIKARVQRMDEQREAVNNGIKVLRKRYEEIETILEDLEGIIYDMKQTFEELDRLRGEAG